MKNVTANVLTCNRVLISSNGITFFAVAFQMSNALKLKYPVQQKDLIVRLVNAGLSALIKDSAMILLKALILALVLASAMKEMTVANTIIVMKLLASARPLQSVKDLKHSAIMTNGIIISVNAVLMLDSAIQERTT